MSRTLLCVALVALPCPVRSDDAPPVAVVVVTSNGKPAAEAKVWVYDYTGTAEAPQEPKPLVADKAGKVEVPGAVGARQLFVRDSAGRIGWAWVFAPRGGRDGTGEIKVILADTAPLAGRVTNPDGKPVAGAVVTPRSYHAGGRRTPGGPSSSIELPEWEQVRIAVTTDAEGRFKIVAPAPGYSVFYRVKADGFGETSWTASAGAELETKLIVPGTVTATATGVDPAALKGTRVTVIDRSSDEAKTGVRPIRYFTGTFDATGKATVTGVVPGRYELVIERNAAIPAMFEKGAAFEVAAGKSAAVTAKFSPAAKVTGKVTDSVTGKGLAGVQVIVNVSDDGGPQPKAQLHVETDANGVYTAHGSAGWYRPWVQRPPDGYSTPAPTGPQREQAISAKVEAGKAHDFAVIALPKSVTFTGRVVLADNKPAVGATVFVHSEMFARGAAKPTDKEGNFAIKNLAPDDAVEPRVRLGNAVNVPQKFELEKTTEAVLIELSEAKAAGFKGLVRDARGTPVAGARVNLQQHIQLVGRNAAYGMVQTLMTTTTDAAGRYSFTGLWPRDQYHVLVTADGFAESEGKKLIGTAGEVGDFGTVKLTRASLSVSGIVVGPDGKPVAGAEVFGVDGPTRFATTSAPDGSFTLTGFYDGAGYVFARKAGHRLAAVPVMPGGKEKVTVALMRTDAPPATAPVVPADHRAALDKFTRHALTLIWESHAAFGYGGSAVRNMARIDPATAKKWRDEEKKRTGGKTDFTYLIDREVRAKALFDTAKDDIDEAIATLGALKPDDGFAEAVRLCELMLAVDKAKAQRLAEEAVVKARQREIPAKLWSLAEAGELAIRAGHPDGGKKVLLEAAELAGKLGPDERGRNALAVGLVASRLAPYDWAKAEKLLNSLKDPSDYNRFLASTIARLAPTDYAKAKQLLDRFKPENSSYPQHARLRVAFAIAKTKPDEAVQLVESVKEGPYRFLGYLGLAAVLGPTDKPRAAKLIDTAFDLLDRDPEAFRSWGNFGGRAALAAMGTVRAKEIGYPDVAGLVARTLALRPTGQDAHSPDHRAEVLVNIAAVLSLVDPATARHVLAGIAPPEEFVTRAVAQRRDWLFALALADPGRAVSLADKLIDRAKNARGGRNALSETGLVELCSILIAADPLKELSSYGNLPREIGGDD